MRRECHVRFCEGGGVRFPSATRLVICCRSKAGAVQAVVAQQLQALGLTLNRAKTRVLDARHEAVTFLGFTLRVVRSRRTGRMFPLVRPSAPACQRVRDTVKALTIRAHLARPTVERHHGAQSGRARVGRLLSLLALRPRLQRPPAVPRAAGPHLPPAQAPDPVVGLPGLSRYVPVRAARALSASGGAVPGSGVCFAVKVLGEPDAGEPHVRFDEGVLEVEQGRAREAPPDERGGNS